MNRKEALNIIGYVLEKLDEYLESNEIYDDQLIIDIGKACQRWEGRQSNLEVPWVVRLFNGCTNSWATISSGLKKEEAYRVWYNSTLGGTINNDSRSDNYYFMCPENIELSGRHEYYNEEDNFSYRYLLDKSFGD